MPKPVRTDGGTLELSLYADEFPTVEDFMAASNRLSIAFPKMTKEFFVLLTEFAVKHEFTAERLSDAVNHVIADFRYRELNISDIIRYDRRVKLYTAGEFMKAQMSGTHPSEFEKREIDGKIYRVLKADLLNQK
ncbi:MAG: hypothetical protein FWF54_00395 [Candidatus Azobacteroides sp.]|nr:hypothetical protein [Candidatus Azobacteroides sp.]